MTFLTKSLFMRGYDCPLRLIHAVNGYPSRNDEDDFLALLADGGRQLECLVHTAWPGEHLGGSPHDPHSDHDRTIDRIHRALAGGPSVLHEACFLSGNRFARVDMLRISSAGIDVCEIKSTSFDGPQDPEAARAVQDGATLLGKRGGIKQEDVRYLADLAFQTAVVEAALAEAGLAHLAIRPRLIVLNKNARAGDWDVYGNFTLKGRDEPALITPPAKGERSGLLLELDATGAVELLRKEGAKSRAVTWAKTPLDAIIADASRMVGGQQDADAARECGWKCRDCEFNHTPEASGQSGFDVCWGKRSELARAAMEFYYGVGYSGPSLHELGRPGEWKWGADWLGAFVNSQYTQGLSGHPLGRLKPEEAKDSRRTTRSLQIDAVRKAKAQYRPDFAEHVTTGMRLPSGRGDLHFLDFEAAFAGIPLAKGMRPYEKFAFQFSVHSVPWDGTEAQVSEAGHREFLCVEADRGLGVLDDDRQLVDALHDAVGDDLSPIYHWSSYEAGILRTVRARLVETNSPSSADIERVAFIDSLIGTQVPNSGRLVDLMRVTEGSVMTPQQKGSYSIKAFLPVVCLDEIPRATIETLMGWSDRLVADGHPVNPYDCLPTSQGTGGTGSVNPSSGKRLQTGSDAIRAFMRLRFPHSNPLSDDQRSALVEALRIYCKLDTAAMVAVWVWLNERRIDRRTT